MSNPTRARASAFQVVAGCGRDQLGEGLTWSTRRGTVFWVDILAPALRALDLKTGTLSRWEMPDLIGWIVERRERNDFIIGLRGGFAELSLQPFSIGPIGDPEPGRPHNRLNDAKVDPAGRIWAGTKDHRDVEKSGALYCLDAHLTWSKRDDHYDVPNGPTFSVDGHTMFHSDSSKRTVYAFDLGADGAIDGKRVFLRFDDEWGYPDGMTTDEENGLWIAHWGGGRVSRFHPNGRLDRSIALPASQITNCAFAGPNLDRMFVTSAAVGTVNEPLAGALFEIDPGVRGLAPTPFAG